MAITELKIFKYECAECSHEWTMINTGKDSRSLDDNGYFCPYCGKKEGDVWQEVLDGAQEIKAGGGTRMPRSAPIKYTPETEKLPRFATDEEAGFKETRTAPVITQKQGEKSTKQLNAEDRMTHLRCTDGGWWNPITKQCQGEGVGHNVEELDNDPTL